MKVESEKVENVYKPGDLVCLYDRVGIVVASAKRVWIFWESNIVILVDGMPSYFFNVV